MKTDNLDQVLREWGQSALASTVPATVVREERYKRHPARPWSKIVMVGATVFLVAACAAALLLFRRGNSNRGANGGDAHSSATSISSSGPVPRNRGGPVYIPALSDSSRSKQCNLPLNDKRKFAGAPVVTVDPRPTSVTAVWYPGRNAPAQACVPPVTRAFAELATRIAAHINSAPTYPPGVYHCPADVARGAILYFTYAHQTRLQTVTVALTGCGSFMAPGRTSRQLANISTDLAPLLPKQMK